ncbi:MAG TPA: retroviral-like aspartic protease family protein [Aliidongia sp.]|nr:retroviral-like aspartic protease family protein [Aliidongia sp.]
MHLADRHIRALALVLSSLFLQPCAAFAESCQLKRAASVPMRLDAGYQLLVPVKLNGDSDAELLVDTGAYASTLTSSESDKLGLSPESIGSYVYGAGGRAINQRVTIKMQLDHLVSGAEAFLVMPDALYGHSGSAGLFGADFLANYDLDLDFGGKKMNLFSQDHCEGHVVYWTQEFIQTPVEIDDGHHVLLPVTLNGRKLRAMLDTGAGVSLMTWANASRLFDLDKDSSDMVESGKVVTADGKQLSSYRHHFQTLEVAGITFHDPTIVIIENGERRDASVGSHINASQTDMPDIILGIRELSKLHLYIAYGEHMLYATPAGAGQ